MKYIRLILFTLLVFFFFSFHLAVAVQFTPQDFSRAQVATVGSFFFNLQYKEKTFLMQTLPDWAFISSP